MQTYGEDAVVALQRVRAVHEPTWIGPALHEQLVLFRLCGFAPRPGVGIYDGWRAKMHAAGQR
jgi:hypothetical protein